MEKIFIIDAVNYLFRSYFAIGPMTNKSGVSTSALYGFIRSVKKLINDFSPNYIVAVFDGPENKESRQKVYSQYKMHRKKAPDDLYPQFELAFNWCKMSGIYALSINGVEADDTMAAIAKWSSEQQLKPYICTSDKDLLQMIDDNIFVLNAHKNNLLYDTQKVKEVYGILPKQMLDYLSIVGDTSDNIPGIAGFGPKNAVALLTEYGTLDNIYNKIEEIKSETKKRILLEGKDNAYMSKILATLDVNVAIAKDKETYSLKNSDEVKLNEFYKEMNFLTLLKDKQGIEEKINIQRLEKKYVLINTEEAFIDLIAKLSYEKEIAIDTETDSLNFMQANLVGIGFCIKEAEAYYVPLNSSLNEKFVLSKIKQLLENDAISFIGHNLKFDYHIFLNHSIKIKNICMDTILASYLISPQNRKHGLDTITLEKFGVTKIPIEDLIGQGKKQISMKDVPYDKICQYCCEDVDYTFRLKNIFQNEIKEKNLDSVLYDIELPLLPILVQMERNGIFVDKDKLFEMAKEVRHELFLIEGEIYSLAGKKFNINSPKQLSEILYVDLALSPPKKAASSFSTSADILEKLKGKSPIIDYIIKNRELQKLLGTYLEAIPLLINPNTQRVHTTFNQSTVATGRLSSKDPNLQNIPIRTEEGKKIREGFRPQKENWVYLSSDYSQIELRLLAHFSEDPNLTSAFNKGEDIHSYTASLVYNVPLENVSSQMRSAAKAVNFGILYGQGAFGLSEQINVTPREAKIFIDTYFQRYNKISSFLEECKRKVYEKKVAYTITGRQRPIPEIDNKNPIIRAAAERLAINTPLQGSAADLIKIAMIHIDKEIKKLNLQGQMILQIHDELLFEIPQNEVDIFKKIVKEKMEGVFQLKVPLTVDIQIGKNLAEC
ncbi:MAG: DNA polymerase I [Parachlamydiales bacterium]|jgi:DNA polymerase-1